MNKDNSTISVNNERGASMIEYTFLASLIFAVCISAVAAVGSRTQEFYSTFASSFLTN